MTLARNLGAVVLAAAWLLSVSLPHRNGGPARPQRLSRGSAGPIDFSFDAHRFPQGGIIVTKGNHRSAPRIGRGPSFGANRFGRRFREG